MVRIEHLVFEYPGLRALDDVSFAIAPGSITALVGPNGAGKTTLLRCMAGLERPLDGQILIDGVDVGEHPREVHRRIGYLSDFFGLYEALTVRQCLYYAADSQLVDADSIDERVQRTAQELGLADRLGTRSGELSRGLRQRLAIGQAIIHAPKLLLLDEPASGLDPEARHALSGLLKALQARGMTLMVSSHILAELEEYCTEMLILRAGRIVEHRGMGAAHDDGVPMRIALASPVPGWRERLALVESIRVIRADDNAALVAFRGDAQARHKLLSQLMAEGLPVCEFAEQQVNLQDSYLATVRAADRRVVP